MGQIPNKPAFKIGEVCEATDTQPYVLRFWESEFPQLAPEKNSSGQRVYRREDVDLVLRIKQLLYEEEYTIAGARKRLEQEQERERTTAAAHGAGGMAPAGGASRGRAGARRADGAGQTPAAATAPLFRSTPDTVDRERYESAVQEIQRLRRDAARLTEERDAQRKRVTELERLCETRRQRAEQVATRLEAVIDGLSRQSAPPPASKRGRARARRK